MRAFVALLFIVPALAGCFTADEAPSTDPAAVPPSPAIHDVLPVQEVWVESAVDAKRIHNAVYRPDTDEPVPVFINFSPYWGDTAEERGDAFSQYMINEYVARGFAVVLSSVRGTGHSEGCFQIGGDLELQDSYDVIDHFANVDWSNGRLAAGGKSYDSTTQNGVIAKFPHEALEGIFHVSGITDMYRYNYRNGVSYTSGTIFNSYYYTQGTDEYGISLIGAGDPSDEDRESIARVIDDAACTEFPEIQAHGVGSAASGQYTDYWIERDWTRHVGSSDWDGSIFFVHGFQDWNVKPDHIQPWLDRLPEQMHVYGWLHQDVEGGTGHVYPMRTDWNQTLLAWLDGILKGDGAPEHLSGIESEATDGIWRHDDTWPPETDPVRVDLAGWTAEEDSRIVGLPRFHVNATIVDPQAVLSVRMFLDGQWVNEAVWRALYDEDLDNPAPATGDRQFTIDGFPMDLFVEAGQTITFDVAEPPRYALTTPAQLAGATGYGVEVVLPLGTLDSGLDAQPQPMDCFTC